MQVFDPSQDYAVIERRLPHWTQAGTITFITWRTWDSMPEKIVTRWQAERNELLLRYGIDANADDWEQRLRRLSMEAFREVQLKLSDRWNDHLDECHGSCVLRRPELATIVADSLRHFDQERYVLTDFVVMPNHVHVMAAFPDENAMLAQCESWKHFTARKINRILGSAGRLWQQDGFDHLVRSVEQFERLRVYFADNPRRAALKDGEYLHYSSQFSRQSTRT
jgi:type I restriction enzyme R subunit